MTVAKPRTRIEWLQEALLLEQLGSEWAVAHVAAFCGVSESFVYRSDCPRVERIGPRAMHGRPRLRFRPADVRIWNAARAHIRGAA